MSLDAYIVYIDDDVCSLEIRFYCATIYPAAPSGRALAKYKRYFLQTPTTHGPR